MTKSEKVKEFVVKLQNLPDKQKKIILWVTVGILAAMMGFFWIRGTMDKIGQISKEVKIPQIQTRTITEPATQTADWKTYTNDKYGFEIKYPADWKITSANIDNVWDDVVFCPISDKNCSGMIQIYVLVYKQKPNVNNLSSHYLGAQNEFYYTLDSFPETDQSLVDQMISTFKFTK